MTERVLGHPSVLRAAGWRVVNVLTRDWHDRPDAAVEAVERALAGDADPGAAIAEEVLQELTRDTAEATAISLPGLPPPPLWVRGRWGRSRGTAAG